MEVKDHSLPLLYLQSFSTSELMPQEKHDVIQLEDRCYNLAELRIVYQGARAIFEHVLYVLHEMRH